MHVDHNRALTRTVDLRRPDVDAQAVFARHRDGGSTMEQKCIFVVARQVMPVRLEVRGILLWANASVRKRVANPGPRFRFGRWHKASGAGRRRTIRHPIECDYAVPREFTDL